jgi:hypothetical protein
VSSKRIERRRQKWWKKTKRSFRCDYPSESMEKMSTGNIPNKNRFSEATIISYFRYSFLMKKFFHIFEWRNVCCIEWCKNQLIILKTNEIISGIFKVIEFVLTSSTVPDKNNKRENIPNEKSLCKIHRKIKFSTK